MAPRAPGDPLTAPAAPAAATPPAAVEPRSTADLLAAACNVMMRVRELERAGDDRDGAVETALNELCAHMTAMPERIPGRFSLPSCCGWRSVRSVGLLGTAYTLSVLADMTDNLSAGESKRLN